MDLSLRKDLLDDGFPSISVIIPLYNQGQYLGEAVQSVVFQDFEDWEIIIVNDGSTDDSVEAALKIIARFPDKRISLINQRNQGLASARNSGIRASQGKYILPLDADDRIDASYMRRTLTALQNSPEAGIAYTDVTFFEALEGTQSSGTLSIDLIKENNQLAYCALYRRAVWEQVGGYNLNLPFGYEDWDFWISCAASGIQAVSIPEPLFYYREKKQSMVFDARRHDMVLRAQIALNHPDVYDEPTRLDATAVIDLFKVLSASSTTPAIRIQKVKGFGAQIGDRDLAPFLGKFLDFAVLLRNYVDKREFATGSLGIEMERENSKIPNSHQIPDQQVLRMLTD